MSATTTAPDRLDVASTPPVPFTRLVQVELRKSYNTRAGFWLLMAIGIVVTLAEVIALLVAIFNDSVDLTFGDYVGVAAFVTGILLPVLGIMLVTGEWGQRTAMVTFALEPRRSRVILAKLVVGFVLTLVTVVSAIGLGALINLIYTVAGPNPASWSFGANYLFGFVIVQSLAMLSGFALATLFLNTPASIVVFFAYKYVLPGLLLLGASLIGWFSNVDPWINFTEAQGPLSDLSISGSEWGHLIVTAILWLGLPMFFGLRRILRAEVK